jgi:predicted nucleic acid-binding protein
LKAIQRGPIYVDTSALVKVYLPEPRSDEVNAAVAGRVDLVVSDLVITEAVAALARRVREGDLAREAAARLHGALLDDLEQDLFVRVELDPATHRAAERFLLSLPVPLRAPDALHLALAASVGAGTLLTFDPRLGNAGLAIGVEVRP